MPLSEMKAGWGGGVCINNNLYNIDESREEDYPLNDPKGEFCSIDKRFELMFETNEKYLYTINDAL